MIKLILKKILQYYLKYITRLVLLIHRPVIIGIAGSTNKTIVKDEIRRILENAEHSGVVRANPKSFNTEIGLPLAILNLPSGYSSYGKWLPVILKAPLAVVQTGYPMYLVLELGVSDPGDMKYLLSIARPDISVITDITQRYRESFSDMDRLAEEYMYLLEKTRRLAVLNYDNPRVRRLAATARDHENIKIPRLRSGQASKQFFGFNAGADWQAVEVNRREYGQKVKVRHGGDISEHRIKRFGSHHINALLAGLIIRSYLHK